MPKLHRILLFQCSVWIKAKVHKHKKGHHEKAYKPKARELFQIDYGLICGKNSSSAELNMHPSTDDQPGSLPSKPCRKEHNYIC